MNELLSTITTRQFLEALWPQGITGYLTLFTRTIDRKRTPVDWAATIDELLDHARHRRSAGDVWFGVATRNVNLGGARRGGADDCAHLPALYADIDVAGPGHANLNLPRTLEEAWKLLDLSPLRPSIVVHTGGGLQPYWLLAEPVARDEAVGLLDRWGAMWLEKADQAGWHLDNVFNVDRVLRLPNTVNHKTAEGREVPIASWHPDLRYGIDDIEPYLPVTVRADTATRETWTGPPRPGDHFNQVMRATDILKRNGWQQQRQDRSGNEHWTRPGKDTRDGSSATYYAVDGHVTIWSDAIPGLDTRRPYDSFGLFTLLEHAGDFTAASQALGKAGFGTAAATQERIDGWLGEHDQPDDPDGPRFAGLIDWPTFWKGEHAEEDWLIEPVLARGRAHALYAPAKAGKSLLALEIAAAMATGRPVFGQTMSPIVVAYVDFEMTESDVHERLTDLGYTANDDLSRLHYYLLPDLPALDTVNGGMLLLEEAKRIGAELVVVDTVARSISGEENSSDTIIALARHTFTPLKRAGITTLRVDHAGKSLEKGQRGTSAKNDDVDVVWRLTLTEHGVQLKATHRRLSWVPETVALRRTEHPLAHLLDPDHDDWPLGTLDCAADLNRLGVPLDLSVKKAAEQLQADGKGRKTDIVRTAVKYRRSMNAKAGDKWLDDVGKRVGKRENDRETSDRETEGNDGV